MAIQNINLGTAPDGVGGDTLRSTATKINANFSNTNHAASKLTGTANGQIPLAEDTGFAVFTARPALTKVDLNDHQEGDYFMVDSEGGGAANQPPFSYSNVRTSAGLYGARYQTAFSATTGATATRVKTIALVWTAWAENYTTLNVTKDSNGFLKAASPIVKVHADKVVLNEEAEQQNVTFKKNGIGDYTITTESGLSTDGWYIELPKDLNGNPKVAVTLSEVEGVITLKSYKRIFSMETFTFEPDLDNPLDIPTDRWIDIRLNEITVDYTELYKEPTEPYSEV